MPSSFAMAGAAVNRTRRSAVVGAVRLVLKYGGFGDSAGRAVSSARGAGAKGARTTVFSTFSSMKAMWTNPVPLPISCPVRLDRSMIWPIVFQASYHREST
jgi:hypothetical protein